VLSQYRFSDELLKGFHGYDFDFCMQVRQQYRVVALRNLLICHLSGGVFSSEYYTAIALLTRKWDQQLPAYINSYSAEEIVQLKIKSLRVYCSNKKSLLHDLKMYLNAVRYARRHKVLFSWLFSKQGFIKGLLKQGVD
jgi:hypothetical protein